MRAHRSHFAGLWVLLLTVLLPLQAGAQTAWFWAVEPRSQYEALPSTVGVWDKVSSPRQLIYGSPPTSGMVGEFAMVQGVLSVGQMVPLPTFADGTQATEAETFWTAQLWRADFPSVRELDHIGDASATFSGRMLTGANVSWGYLSPNVQVLVNVMAVRAHDNRRSNR